MHGKLVYSGGVFDEERPLEIYGSFPCERRISNGKY
jgi:hypothetical protein